MLKTPWGDAGSLREKRLRPGGGVPPEEVARNQRERLFAAMVACVDQKGFEATTVADLLELSGISRTTFYEHFDDKRDCFVAAVEAIVETTATLAAQRVAEISDGDTKARTLLEGFVGSVVAQPAASRMCFVESAAAGRGALVAVNRAVSRFDAILREAVEQTPGRQGLSDEIRNAQLGAIYLIVHARLYRREEAELESLAAELWEWANSIQPLPRPLGSAPARRPSGVPAGVARSPHARPPGAAAADPAERIIRGFAAVAAEKGYPATTIAEIADRASVSQSTFYSHFKGREQVMLSALDTAGARLMAAILPAARRGESWPDSMRLAIRALGAFGVDEPDLTSLLGVAAYGAGPLAMVRRDEITVGLEGLFTPGYELFPDTAAITAEASVRAIYSLLYNKIAVNGPESLPAIVPMATYIALCPFVGAEKACEVAAGD
jgi:AcrR family transcriptional regulator